MNQGLFIFNIKNGITFVNRYIQKIILKNGDNDYVYKSSDIFHYDYSLNCVNGGFYQEIIENRDNMENMEHVDGKDNRENTNKEYFQNKINKLFSKFKYINPTLNNNISDYIKTLSEGEFDLGEFIKSIEKEKSNMFSVFPNSEFIYLGMVYWQYEDPNFIFNKIEPLNYGLELRIRRIDEDREISYQFLLTDVTKAIKIEKKNTINLCKSNFLEKIAHEIRNPLCSILELSDEIDTKVEELKKENLLTTDHVNDINISTKYIRNITKLMNYIIQDFSISSNISELCLICDKTQDLCNICQNFSKCSICKSCYNCNENKNQHFDYNTKIKECIEVFKTKNEVDGKVLLDYQIEVVNNNEVIEDSCSYDNYIMVNNIDYFMSIIFNLLYYIYNKSNLMNLILFRYKSVHKNLDF